LFFVLLNENGFVDHVAHGDVLTDAVFDVLEHFFCPRAFSEAHHGTTYPVGADLDGFNDADVIAGVVIHQQGATGRQTAEANRRRGQVEDFDAPVSFIGRFTGEGQLDGAGFFVDRGAVKRQRPSNAASRLDLFGCGH